MRPPMFAPSRLLSYRGNDVNPCVAKVESFAFRFLFWKYS